MCSERRKAGYALKCNLCLTNTGRYDAKLVCCVARKCIDLRGINGAKAMQEWLMENSRKHFEIQPSDVIEMIKNWGSI
jgi:hypothetical protein